MRGLAVLCEQWSLGQATSRNVLSLYSSSSDQMLLAVVTVSWEILAQFSLATERKEGRTSSHLRISMDISAETIKAQT